MDPRFPNERSLKINRDTVSTTSTNNTVFRLPSVSILQSAERAGAMCFFNNQCWYFSEVSNAWLPFGTGLPTTLSNAGLGANEQTLVAAASAYPAFLTKGLNPGTGISLSSNFTDLTVNASLIDAGIAGGHAGIPVTTPAPAANAPLPVKGIVAGAGITVTSNNTDITIASSGGAPIAPNLAEFYGLTSGTGNGGPNDYAATVGVGTPVVFPRTNVVIGSTPITLGALGATFTVHVAGTYRIFFRVHTTEPGQLQLTQNGTALAYTTVANMNPTAGGHPIVGDSFVTAATGDVFAVLNPIGNSTALTITPADGSETWANAQTVTIQQIA
jgi:hypothetical protein